MFISLFYFPKIRSTYIHIVWEHRELLRFMCPCGRSWYFVCEEFAKGFIAAKLYGRVFSTIVILSREYCQVSTQGEKYLNPTSGVCNKQQYVNVTIRTVFCTPTRVYSSFLRARAAAVQCNIIITSSVARCMYTQLAPKPAPNLCTNIKYNNIMQAADDNDEVVRDILSEGSR